MEYRIEKDFIGEKKIPLDAYWGIHTARAMENFTISRYTVNPGLITAYALVKKACALANSELGYLDKRKAEAIITACDEIADGKFLGQFSIDALQGGAGTSTNMNVNEVIANRAIELLGGHKGDYAIVNPLEHVNLHQSTNDTYPTALKIAAIYGVRQLSEQAAKLQGAFQKKEKEFTDIVKIGRTEMQEAVPLTLGAEFSAFAEAIGRDRWRTFKCEERLRVVNLGGTAVGTGLGTPRSFIFLAIEKLRRITGLGLSRGENMVDQTANSDAFVEVSGILKAHASNLIKINNDLRLLNLLGEIDLPKVQAGSSIMPGKVNPVGCEAAIQAGLKVISNDALVTEAVSRSTLQITEFMPLLGFALLESIDLLSNIDAMTAGYAGEIRAHPEKCRSYVDQSPTLITAFLPSIGYDAASGIIREFPASHKTVRGFLEEKLGIERVEEVLSPHRLTSLGYKDDKNT